MQLDYAVGFSLDVKYEKLKSNDIHILVDDSVLSLCLGKEKNKTLMCYAFSSMKMSFLFPPLSLSKFIFLPSFLSLPAVEGNVHGERMLSWPSSQKPEPGSRGALCLKDSEPPVQAPAPHVPVCPQPAEEDCRSKQEKLGDGSQLAQSTCTMTL